MQTFELDNKMYAIDIDKLMVWVALTPENERNVTRTISRTTIPFGDNGGDGGDGDDGVNVATTQKDVTETKNTLNDGLNTIRYDLIKTLLATIISPVMDAETGTVANVFTFGQVLSFNTLLAKGIIYEVNAQ